MKGIIVNTNAPQSKKYQLDIESPIVPSEGLGGLLLGSSLLDSNLQDMIYDYTIIKGGTFSMRSPFVAHYLLVDSLIGIRVDVRNGKIFQLTAYKGYKGKLLNLISPDMPVFEIKELVPSLYYDEFNEQFAFRDFPGVSFDLPEEPFSNFQPTLDMKITAINIFDTRIDTPQGMQGFWDQL